MTKKKITTPNFQTETRSRTIVVRVTPSEDDFIALEAGQAGVKKSEIIRTALQFWIDRR